MTDIEKIENMDIEDLVKKCCELYALYLSDRLSGTAQDKLWREYLLCKREIVERVKTTIK